RRGQAVGAVPVGRQAADPARALAGCDRRPAARQRRPRPLRPPARRADLPSRPARQGAPVAHRVHVPRRDAPGGRHHACRLPWHRHDARAVPPGRPTRDRAAAAAPGMRSLVSALLEPVAYPSVYDVTVRAVGDGTISLTGDNDDLRRQGVYGVYSERAYGRIGTIIENDAAGVVRGLEPVVGELRAGDPVGVSLYAFPLDPREGRGIAFED